jgi:hypothetical protein
MIQFEWSSNSDALAHSGPFHPPQTNPQAHILAELSRYDNDRRSSTALPDMPEAGPMKLRHIRASLNLLALFALFVLGAPTRLNSTAMSRVSTF